MQEWSRKIDQLIEDEKDVKAQLPSHPRFTPMRIKLDIEIAGLRTMKKEALLLWREVKRNPEIVP